MRLDAVEATDPARFPLLAFVHVPNTAGSTVKNVLGLCSPRGHAFVETLIHKGQEFIDSVRGYDWVGGHVTRDGLHSALRWLGRPVEYFSSVREPTSHVISQLNYSFERQLRPGYLQSHSLDEQLLDTQVREIDFTNPNSVKRFLLTHDGQVLNMQSRLLLGNDFSWLSEAEMKRRLGCYCYLATERTIPELCRAFGFAQLPEGYAERRDNIARKHFSTEVFDSPELKIFLAWRNRHDELLYATVRQADWTAAKRSPVRPALLAYDSVGHENFEEQRYLDSNPDVANAVSAGLIGSGRHHFDRWGHSEERKYRSWIFPPRPETRRRRPSSSVWSVCERNRPRAPPKRCARTTAAADFPHKRNKRL
jgi:hypothetical protein